MKVIDLGRMSYLDCAALQRELLERVAAGSEEDTLLLVEHDPVITLGANFHAENLLLSEQALGQRGITVCKSERGGDVTYHGPGQLVAYPIFNLSRRGRDLHRWLRDLEEVVIRSIAGFGISGHRFAPYTGVWVGDAKICAIGVKVRRWTSMHGLALNCESDLDAFDLIVPCGIRGYGVTSISREVGRRFDLDEVKPVVVSGFLGVFGEG